jgi:hypothetical protein
MLITRRVLTIKKVIVERHCNRAQAVDLEVCAQAFAECGLA